MSQSESALSERSQNRSRIELRMSWLELGITFALLVVLAYYVIKAWNLPVPLNPDDVGPGAFPLLVGGGTIFALALLLVGAARRAKNKTADGGFGVSRPVPVAMAAAALLITAALFETLGAYIVLTLCSLVLLAAGGERRPAILIAVPLGMTLGIYVLFVLILGVRFS